MKKISPLTTNHAESVTLSSDGTTAYIADGTNGLVIVDIRDPTNPTKLGSYYTYGISLDGPSACAKIGKDLIEILE